MNALTMSCCDTATMLRRDLRHAVRYPMATLSGFLVPVAMLLLFDGVFGRTLRTGLEGTLAGGYIGYVAPGMLALAAAGVAEMTALNVNLDMSEGIISRLRTMAIWRPSVLVGQVAGSVIRTLITSAAVCAVAVGLGFRPNASPLDWLAAAGLLTLVGAALAWLTVAFGLVAKTPAGANGLSLILLLLPFVSSAFVPTSTMPAGVRAFAEYQPFTSIIDTQRALLTGSSIGTHGFAALAWCAGLTAIGYIWSVRLYNRAPMAAG